MRRGLALTVLFATLAVPPFSACADESRPKKKNADVENIGSRDVTRGTWNLYSPERELELGEELARKNEASSRLLKDAFVVEYVTEVADRIGRNSDLRVPLRVRVVDSDEIDAFALPGGHFFVTTGLLLEARTEAELAAVMSHEIAHVAARHATRSMTRVKVWNLASLPLLFFGGPVVYGIQQGLALAVPLTFLRFSRNDEREADFLGLQYHAASGYDPVAFIDFFERIRQREKTQRGGIAKAFSTHPMTRDRIITAERTIEQVLPPREEYVVTTSRHAEVQQHLESLQGERRRRESDQNPVLRRRDLKSDSSGEGKKPLPF